MPLGILIPMVVIGITGITLLLHLLGQSQIVTLADDEAARSAWLREYPDAMPTRVVLSHDHHAALVETAQGYGVVWPMGADTTARMLRNSQIERTAGGLRIDLADFAAPHINLHLDADEADLWPALIRERA